MSGETLGKVLVARLAAMATPLPGSWWPLRLPERISTFPAGTYQRITGGRGATHTGPIDLTQRRYQLMVYAKDYDRGRAAADRVMEELVGVDAWDGVSVFASLADDYEDVDPAREGLYRFGIDLMIQSVVA